MFFTNILISKWFPDMFLTIIPIPHQFIPIEVGIIYSQGMIELLQEW